MNHKYVEKLKEDVKNYEKVQKHLLLTIVEDNKDTEYGKKYNFKNIKSISDYQNNVPIIDYEDIRLLIDRMNNNKEKNIIISKDPCLYNVTSGTSGKEKIIPQTKESSRVINHWRTKYVNEHIAEILNIDNFPNGKGINLIEVYENSKTLKDGNDLTDQATDFLKGLMPIWDDLYANPIETIFNTGNCFILYLIARLTLVNDGITFINSVYVTEVLSFFEYIMNNWEMLVNDIRTGKISHIENVNETNYEKLIKLVKPLPDVADRLESIFKNRNSDQIISKLWPSLQIIIVSGSGVYEQISKQLQEKYLDESIILYRRGILSSEACYTVNIDGFKDEHSFIPDSVFYEFIEYNSNSKEVLTLSQLENGKKYELIITGRNGLYRYKTNDIFEVININKENNIPIIKFVCRNNVYLDLFGEKFSEIEVIRTIEGVREDFGLDKLNAIIYPDYQNICYVYLVELNKDIKYDDLINGFERNMAIQNDDIDTLLKHKILHKTVIKYLEPGTFEKYDRYIRGIVNNINQEKRIIIIRNEKQKEFFLNCVKK